MRSVGAMQMDRERLELANCPTCGSTCCVELWRLSSSSHWRIVERDEWP
jgi:hypothetical protein